MVIEHETMENTKKERTEVGALAPKIASGDNVCGGSAYSFSNFWRFNNHQTHSTIIRHIQQFYNASFNFVVVLGVLAIHDKD